MNNKNKIIESKDELKAKLLKSLEETGYPLELKVGNIFSKRGWNVEHNRYYVDEDEKKAREVDIAAFIGSKSQKDKLSTGLGLICEVKQSLKHPWVILSTGRGAVEGEGWLRLHYAIGNTKIKLPSGKQIETMSTTRQFKRIGRSYCEGFKTDNAQSVIFKALTTVVKASEHWLKAQMEALEKLEKKKKSPLEIAFVDPVVILDGLLYECYLKDDNQLVLDEISHIPISFTYVSKQYPRSSYPVEIVTIDELPNLLLKKKDWIVNIKDSLINTLRKSSK